MEQNKHSGHSSNASFTKNAKLKSILSSLFFVLGVFLTAFVINQTIFHSYYVVGTSMVPTLQGSDWLIIEKVSRSLSVISGNPYIPKRGQIVVLDSSLTGESGKEEQLIKRVVGLPGDTVTVENGKVIVKNAQNPEGFDVDIALGLNLGETYSQTPITQEVGANEVFVLGDNRGRNESLDSRLFGPINTADLEGRLWARLLPVTKAQLFN